MLLSIFWLVVGLVLILVGANMLTDGSSAVAKRFGISDVIIGLTVVAFGTSTPELAISIVASLDNNASLAVGNVVGSNIFNILAIIGITAVIRPIRIQRSIMSSEMPMLFLSSLILWVMGNSVLLDGAADNVITRVEGIMLLIFFALFMRYTFAKAHIHLQRPDDGPDPIEQKTRRHVGDGMPLWKSVVFIVVGLAGLVWGGDKFVDGASSLARSLGVSDAVIGLTIVAVGTSLPELATSVVAAVKRKPGLAVGNVIGSNIFNVLLILGTASVIRPLPFGEVSELDLNVLMGASVLFWVFGWLFRRRMITRPEGFIMAACYIAYMVYLVMTSVH